VDSSVTVVSALVSSESPMVGDGGDRSSFYLRRSLRRTIFGRRTGSRPAKTKILKGELTQEHHHQSHSWSLYTISILVQMAASLNQELQELILRSLDADVSIADTSKLVLPSHPSSPVDQQVAQAVLTSLASRHVL
jgi:hypothetical protein